MGVPFELKSDRRHGAEIESSMNDDNIRPAVSLSNDDSSAMPAATAHHNGGDNVSVWDLPPLPGDAPQPHQKPNMNNMNNMNSINHSSTNIVVEEPNEPSPSTPASSNSLVVPIPSAHRHSSAPPRRSDVTPISIAMDGPSPSPHFVSLENVARLYLEMKNERDFLVRESSSIFNDRVKVVNQLRQLEVQLNHLLQQKSRLEENLDTLGLRDEQNRSKITALDEKVATISSESLRFEATVRDLKGGSHLSAPPSATSATSTTNVSHDSSRNVEALKIGRKPSAACKRTLYGHTGSVLGVDVCEATKVLITASADRSLRTWDVTTGRRIDTLYGHEGWVHAVTFGIDGETAVSGSGDKTVKVWDLNDARGRGTCTVTLRGHDAGVTCVQLDDDNILVSGSLDRTLRRVDLNGNVEECSVIQGHENGVYCLQFVRHGIASGGGDGLIRMHDVRTGRCHRTLQGHSGGAVRALQFNDNQLISGGSDHDLRFWDLRTASCTATVNVGARINALQFDAHTVYVACADRTLKVYDTDTQSLITEHGGHLGPITSLAAFDDYYYTGSADQTTKVWHLPPSTPSPAPTTTTINSSTATAPH